MQHEIVVLLAHLLFEQNKEITYDKFVPTIMMKLYQNDILAKSFVKQWSSGELDNILTEHFLFDKERNEKLRTMAKQFLSFVESEDAKESSESDSDSSSGDSDSESKSGESD